MYCEKCGAIIDEEAAFCKKCGAQNSAKFNAKNENAEPIIIAEKSIFFRNLWIVSYFILLLMSIGFIMLLAGMDAEVSLKLIEMKHSSFNYSKISMLEDQLKWLRSLLTPFIVFLVITNIMIGFTIAVKIIRIEGMRLLLTNEGVIGRIPGIIPGLFKDKSWNVLYQDITNAYVKKFGQKNGWIFIESKFNEKIFFCIRQPDYFLYRLNEQIKKAQQ